MEGEDASLQMKEENEPTQSIDEVLAIIQEAKKLGERHKGCDLLVNESSSIDLDDDNSDIDDDSDEIETSGDFVCALWVLHLYDRLYVIRSFIEFRIW